VPKRVIDFDAMWGSDKLASCAAWAQAEYAWLYGLADASGCFEITNLRVIWGRVAAIRENFTIERLEQVFAEFQDKGLLFVWEHEGKRYAHWTGSDVPGRLPPPSWRMRLEKFAPPVPKQRLAEYMGRFARGRAALAGVGFRGEEAGETGRREEECGAALAGAPGGANEDSRFEISDLKKKLADIGCGGNFGASRPGLASGGEAGGGRGAGSAAGTARSGHLQFSDARLLVGVHGERHESLEEAQAQDLDLGLNLDLKGNEGLERVGRLEAAAGNMQVFPCEEERRKDSIKNDSFHSSSNSNSRANSISNSSSNLNSNSSSNANANANSLFNANSDSVSEPCHEPHPRPVPCVNFNSRAMSAKELAVERELRVGAGPVCGPRGVKPEVLERIRLRELARAGKSP
jgi:hypothetical protein